MNFRFRIEAFEIELGSSDPEDRGGLGSVLSAALVPMAMHLWAEMRPKEVEPPAPSPERDEPSSSVDGDHQEEQEPRNGKAPSAAAEV